MSFQVPGFDPMHIDSSLEPGLSRRPGTAPQTSSTDERPWTPRPRAHVTRVLGKLCFSCRSVNSLGDKFCAECGAPLFRPPDSQMYRTALP